MDLVEVRLVNSRYCRENGWRDEDGLEQWDRVNAWSMIWLKIILAIALYDVKNLLIQLPYVKKKHLLFWMDSDVFPTSSSMPLKPICHKVEQHGLHCHSAPMMKKELRDLFLFRCHCLKSGFKNLILIDPSTISNPLDKLILKGKFHPVLTQISGDKRWAARIRFYDDEPVIHFMNTALVAVPHPDIKDIGGIPILKDIESPIENNNLVYRINIKKITAAQLSLISPELGEETRNVDIRYVKKGLSEININLDGVKVYATVQNPQHS